MSDNIKKESAEDIFDDISKEYGEKPVSNTSDKEKISVSSHISSSDDSIVQKVRNDSNQKSTNKYSNAKKGDIIKLGRYMQNSDEPEPIEWLVLDVDGKKALVISKYALECRRYNEEWGDITWEKCTLRKWLNNEFYNKAFSDNDKGMIIESDVKAEENPEYSISQGEDTADNVFLLSIAEVNKYFKSDNERQCQTTLYSKQQGNYIKHGHVWWWLRSLGIRTYIAAYVNTDGSVIFLGDVVNDDNIFVRPALWINIES